MRSMRRALNNLLYRREHRGADEICIHMLSEQLYFKAQQLPAAASGAAAGADEFDPWQDAASNDV